jgi:malonyl CoA-acyl carrier protein transacylase
MWLSAAACCYIKNIAAQGKVSVELLAYKFALPVHWVQAQDILFTCYNFDCSTKIGPLSTLTGMDTQTLNEVQELG